MSPVDISLVTRREVPSEASEVPVVAGVSLKGRYVVDRLPLAHSGMGEVWSALDRWLQRRVIIKLINPAWSDADTVRRFKREALLTARLEHPGVPAVYDVDVYEGRPYLVLQKIDGITLSDLIAEYGPLPMGWVAAIGAQVCSVLMAAREIGLVHRDIKPSNLMLETSGAVKVLDFGLAAALGNDRYSRITQSGQTLGTIGYMAPEQILGEVCTHRTDIYGLGGTLFELATGQPPADGPTTTALLQRQLTDPPPRARQLRPEVPEILDELLASMLATDAIDRPADATYVYDVLATLVDELPAIPGVVTDLHDAQRAYSSIVGRVPHSTRSVGTIALSAADELADLAEASARAAELLDVGRAGEALMLLEAVLRDHQGAIRETGEGFMQVEAVYASTLHQVGKYRAAARQWRHLERRHVERNGADSQEVFDCRLQAARAHVALGEQDRALSQLNALLQDRERAEGPEHRAVLELRQEIARVRSAISSG